MSDNTSRQETGQTDDSRLKFGRLLLNLRARNGVRSVHFWVIAALLVVFSLIFYFVIKDLHDIYLVLFLYPLLYAALVFRLRGVIITTLIFMVIMVPYVFFLSEDAYSFIRAILFPIFAFLLSGLVATLLNYLEVQMEAYQEIVALNQELNRYIQKLETTQKQLILSERLSAVGELSASVAHEINNPLAGVLVYSKLLSRKLSSGKIDREEMLADFNKIEDAVNHCTQIVRGLLDFSRQSEPNFEQVDLSEVITRVITLIEHQAVKSRVEIVRQEVPVSPVFADSRQLQQVFLNLIMNAIQAMPGGGKLTVGISNGSEGWVKVSVSDTGVGIPPENMPKLFTPFFTTKGEKGVGLGLAVSYGIVERHGGRIEVQSEVGKGSTFTVFLPAVRATDKEPGQKAGSST